MGVMEHLDVRLRRLVAHAAERGFTFDELARAATQVGVTSLTLVVDWLAHARSSGLVEDMGYDQLPDGSGPGPRRYRAAAATAQEPSSPAASAAEA